MEHVRGGVGDISGLINTNRGSFKASRIHSEQANYLGHQVGHVGKFKKAATRLFPSLMLLPTGFAKKVVAGLQQ